MKIPFLCLAVMVAFSSNANAEIALKIGILNDQSGAYSDISGVGSVVAARMAIEDFNAAGKGLKVDIISGDHQNKADVGLNIARQWYNLEGVDAIVDVPTSSVGFAVANITRDNNKVFLASGSASSDLTGSQCSPNTIHWTFDTYSLSQATAKALVQLGGKNWFFITADYAFGHALERDTGKMVIQAGGAVVGSVRAPFSNADFASYLLKAQSSNAGVIAFANAGSDLSNSIKQATEFGLTQTGKQRLAALTMFVTDIDALGLNAAQGLLLTEPFYWDLNEQTRAWSARFAAINKGRMPTSVHAGVYASVLHYLKAVEKLQDKSGIAVVAKMKELPTDDPLFGAGSIRPDGRTIHNMYLFEVKQPAESKGRWDYYKLAATIPGDEAFRPLSEGGCALIKK